MYFGAAIKLDEIKVLVISGTRPDMNAIKSDTPSEVTEKMQRCWQEDPKERPTSLGKALFFSTLLIFFHIQIALGKKNLLNPAQIKTNTCKSQYVPMFLKKSHKFNRKTTFIRSHSVALSTFSLHRKLSLNFRIKSCSLINQTHKTSKITILH